MAKSPAYPDQAERLRAARIESGFSKAKEAARLFRWNYTTYSQHERGERGLKRGTAAKYARAYGTSVAWLLTGEGRRASTVPVIGHVTARGVCLLHPANGAKLAEAALPYGAQPGTVAIAVEGNALRLIAEAGWLVTYEPRADLRNDDLLGGYCVVGLTDGRVLIRYLARGRSADHFDLRSPTAAPIRNVKVAWAAPISAIVPRHRPAAERSAKD